jgi:hypothetical protein
MATDRVQTQPVSVFAASIAAKSISAFALAGAGIDAFCPAAFDD